MLVRCVNLGPWGAGEGGTGDCVVSPRLVCAGVTMSVLHPFLQSYLIVSDKARDAAAVLVSR